MFPSRHDPIRAVLAPRLSLTSRFKQRSSRRSSCEGDRHIFRSPTNLLCCSSLLAAFLLLNFHLLGGSASGLGSTPHPAATASRSPQNSHPKLTERGSGKASRDVCIRAPNNRRPMAVSVAVSTLPDNAPTLVRRRGDDWSRYPKFLRNVMRRNAARWILQWK